jgi:hypothetical protein
MSFSDIEGAPVVRGSKAPFEVLFDQVTREVSGDESESNVEKARVGDIALAVGLHEGRREGKIADSDHQEFNLDSLDRSGAMKAIIEERHPEAAGKELRAILQEYLEGGLQVIADDVDEYGFFRYAEYLPAGNS